MPVRDTSEFDEFYAGTSRRVLGQVYAMTGDMAAAEDAVAEAYTRAWQRWPSVSRADSPEAWVRTVASRTAISTWRKTRNRLRAHHRLAPSTTDPTVLGPDHVVLVDALRQIPHQQRQALVLHYVAGATVAEIAREMGAAEGTVKSWLSRGRAALNARLTEPSSSVPAAPKEVRTDA